MAYDEDQEVKDVEATVLLKVKFNVTLLGADYNGSDGTDAGAVFAAFAEDGLPDWEEMSLHQILSTREI